MPYYSLTEIETHCRKAARGAGYEWGEAEEVGKAVRWLCAAGINGAAEVLELLQAVDGKVDKYRPNAGLFQGDPQQQVCGLSLGCALADRGVDTLPEGIDIIAPMIAYGIICNAHKDTGKTALAEFPGLKIQTTSPMTEVKPQAWDALNRFVMRTYVPATEESRLKGAG
jgi:uncharacterized protein DUF3726